ncbi:MAG: threonine ammonia-lyase [Promethearchaeota archaeon]|jgi:threonine dehydratase
MTELQLETIKEAYDKIKGFIRKTPLIHSAYLSEICNNKVYLKLENLQLTNAFKIRGALNRMLKLSSEEKSHGVITASSGNHAQGIALAAKHLGVSAKIVVPKKISEAKLKKIKQYDVSVIQEGDFDEIETKARNLSNQEKRTYISPYNDIDIIIGQGTIALEIYNELEQVDVVIVPIGGGGLISGIALTSKLLNSNIKIIGVQTKGASTMFESWKAGKIIEIEEFKTIAEGLLGGLESGAITFEIIQKYVDEIMLVEEENVEKAINILWKDEGQIVEGAGATVVALLIENKQKFKNKNVVAVISGGNINESLFKEILSKS